MEVLALSSGESELGALVRACTEGLGMQSLLKDFSVNVSIVVKSDATAAIGMARRQGLGRVRHLATSDLWIQQRLRAGDFAVTKHPGISNSADLMTKVKSRNEILKFLQLMGFVEGAGRPTIAPIRTQWTISSPVICPSGSGDRVEGKVDDVDSNYFHSDPSNATYTTYILEGKDLITDRSLPHPGSRVLCDVLDLNSGEWVYTSPSLPPNTTGTTEPDLSHLSTDIRPYLLATWKVFN